ncbi:MAG: hypothetical protein ACI8PZ_002380 [Myxococcota bacterium]|jgi:hypothetical protein
MAAVILPNLGLPLVGVEQVHHVRGRVWGSLGRTICVDGEPWSAFPRRPGWDAFERHRSWRRVLRGDRCVVRPLPWGVLGIRAGWGYRLTPGGAERLWPFHRGAPLRGAVAATDEAAWVGDYWANPRHEPVVIWRISPDFTRRPAYVFPTGAVRHVHRIQVDPVDGALWATTGDRDGACFLWRTADGFRTVDRVGDGTQRFRATHLCFTERHVSWCTDTERGVNHVVRVHRRTGAVEVGAVLPAPVWSGALTADGWHLVATGVERGPGVRTRSAQVFASRDAWSWSVVATVPKDRWPHRAGKHGLLWFPTGTWSLAEAVVSGEALVGVDGVARPLALLGGWA